VSRRPENGGSRPPDGLNLSTATPWFGQTRLAVWSGPAGLGMGIPLRRLFDDIGLREGRQCNPRRTCATPIRTTCS
jgi:hypothetical protein